MTIAMIAMLGTMMVHVPPSEDDIFYEEIIFEALTYCKNFTTTDEKRIQNTEKMLWSLVEVERRFHVPHSLRGMILSAACAESGYNPKAKGDRRLSRNKKKPMAIGLLQLWPIYEKMYPGLDRTDPIASAHAWMKHIIRQIPKVKRKCKYRKERKIWVAAWVTGVRYYKRSGRCREKPKHLRILKKWHKSIKRHREEGCDC